jgi:predicted  nucleic acid-binding Zn-ribbon protein
MKTNKFKCNKCGRNYKKISKSGYCVICHIDKYGKVPSEFLSDSDTKMSK